MSVETNSPQKGNSDDPLWRKHFPVESELEATQSRRAFLGGATVAGGAMACGQGLLHQVTKDSHADAASLDESLSAKVSNDAAVPSSKVASTAQASLVLDKKFDELRIGEALLFHYPHHHSPCLLVKLSETDYVAFAQKCTHLACPVIPEVSSHKFHCPCHHGAFDLETGQPMAGPPRAPLRKVTVQLAADGTLTATGLS